MSKPYDTRLVMMVAQNPFDVTVNQFCTLIPLVYVDGTLPVQDDFPNDGEIWWMLMPYSVQFAKPGRIVIGVGDNLNCPKKDNLWTG